MTRIAHWRIAGEEEHRQSYVDGEELFIPDSQLRGPGLRAGQEVEVRLEGEEGWESYTLGKSRRSQQKGKTWNVFKLKPPEG